jgi:hypothetical protein
MTPSQFKNAVSAFVGLLTKWVFTTYDKHPDTAEEMAKHFSEQLPITLNIITSSNQDAVGNYWRSIANAPTDNAARDIENRTFFNTSRVPKQIEIARERAYQDSVERRKRLVTELTQDQQNIYDESKNIAETVEKGRVLDANDTQFDPITGVNYLDLTESQLSKYPNELTV